MSNLSTTKLSSKGQVVIPEEVRANMGLEAGDQFVVVAGKDVVILKTIARPSMKEFNGLIKEARKQAKQAGLTKGEVSDAVKKSRKRKRK